MNWITTLSPIILLLGQCTLTILTGITGIYVLRKEFRKQTLIAKTEASRTKVLLISYAVLAVGMQVLAYYNNHLAELKFEGQITRITKENTNLKNDKALETIQRLQTETLNQVTGGTDKPQLQVLGVLELNAYYKVEIRVLNLGSYPLEGVKLKIIDSYGGIEKISGQKGAAVWGFARIDGEKHELENMISINTMPKNYLEVAYRTKVPLGITAFDYPIDVIWNNGVYHCNVFCKISADKNSIVIDHADLYSAGKKIDLATYFKK